MLTDARGAMLRAAGWSLPACAFSPAAVGPCHTALNTEGLQQAQGGIITPLRTSRLALLTAAASAFLTSARGAGELVRISWLPLGTRRGPQRAGAPISAPHDAIHSARPTQ